VGELRRSQSPPEVLQTELEVAETEDQVVTALQRAYDSIDQLHDQYVGLNWIHLDCRKNCFWCCYLRVDAKAHEILVIARHVQTTFTSESATL
jgi:hypothetical protein